MPRAIAVGLCGCGWGCVVGRAWRNFLELLHELLVSVAGVVGGQVPCALGWALATGIARALEERKVSVSLSFPRPAAAVEEPPDAPDYKLFNPPFGEGAYGKVWLARNKAGQWRALKAVYLANFEQNTGPYEREFNGIKKYQPISDQHPGLLRVEFVSEKRKGHFYYVMELGDP